MPEDKEALWKESQTRLAGGMREDARRFLRSFIQRFPSDPRASQAQLQVGQSFAQEFKYGLAVAEYLAVMSRFSRSPEVPEAMWQLGEAYVAMKYCTDAKAIFLDLSKRYPKSPRAAQVKERLRDIQKIARNKDLCTS
jgi:TolA-binding protein